MARSTKFTLGVDIGGTKVEAGLVSSNGKVLVSARSPMVARGSAADGFKSVCAAIDQVLSDARTKRVTAVGVSVPGWVDSARGVVVSATNLPCWRNYPLAQKIQSHYKLPARVANDANAGAQAELKWGAGADYENMFYVTLGTGIGTGIVLRGELVTGTMGGAGEGGHMSIDLHGALCGCGKRGCIEMYASGTALARNARAALAKSENHGSAILRLAGCSIDSVTAEAVTKAAGADDSLAKKLLEDAADNLAIWLGGVIDLLEPEVIVIGGGFGRVMMRYAPRVRKMLNVWSINPNREKVKIVKADYLAQSALVGAAALWLPAGKTSQ